jgi:hypothetical protein
VAMLAALIIAKSTAFLRRFQWRCPVGWARRPSLTMFSCPSFGIGPIPAISQVRRAFARHLLNSYGKVTLHRIFMKQLPACPDRLAPSSVRLTRRRTRL